MPNKIHHTAIVSDDTILDGNEIDFDQDAAADGIWAKKIS